MRIDKSAVQALFVTSLRQHSSRSPLMQMIVSCGQLYIENSQRSKIKQSLRPTKAAG